jgi:cytochrome c5
MKKRRSRFYGPIAVVLVAAGVSFPGLRLFARENTHKQASPPATSSENVQKSGEQVFMENCSRCHKPPMTISPRITGTIIMHMRVRAKLSQKDEQALLRYLAP